MGSLRCLTGGKFIITEYTLTEHGGAFVKEGSILPMTLDPSRLSDNGPSATTTASTTSSTSTTADAKTDANTEANRLLFDAMDVEDAAADGRHPLLGGAQEIPRTLVWEAYIGNATSGTGIVQEDDASGNEYMNNTGAGTTIATTTANYTVGPTGQTLQFAIAPTVGTYAGMLVQRNYEVRLRGAWSPTNLVVTIGGGNSGGGGGHKETKVMMVPVGVNRRPRRSCGKLRCRAVGNVGGSTALASWWWDAATMTAFARVDDVLMVGGVTLEFTFSTTLQHGARFLTPIVCYWTSRQLLHWTEHSCDLKASLSAHSVSDRFILNYAPTCTRLTLGINFSTRLR
jgi:hypothetical protein